MMIFPEDDSVMVASSYLPIGEPGFGLDAPAGDVPSTDVVIPVVPQSWSSVPAGHTSHSGLIAEVGADVGSIVTTIVDTSAAVAPASITAI